MIPSPRLDSKYTKVGGIVYWVAAAGKDEDILLQMAVFYTAFALIVPIFVFVAYLKRARALYGLAILVTLLVVSVLTPPTNALRVIADKGLLTEDGKSYLSSFILIPIAMVRPVSISSSHHYLS